MLKMSKQTHFYTEQHTVVIEVLLDSKADINAKDINGSTPLHIAANNVYEDAVKKTNIKRCECDQFGQ